MTDALASTDSQASGEEIEESGSTDALPVDRLEALSDAAFGAGSIERAIELREQAYRRLDDANDTLGVGRCAVWLAFVHFATVRPSIGGGWLRRAQIALAGHEEEEAYGELLLLQASGARAMGQLDAADATARAALELAKRLRDADVQALALQLLGLNLLDSGQAADGMAHFDDSMLFAVEGRLRAITLGQVYCGMIAVCEEVGDVRRAAEWTTALRKWTDEQPFSVFPGVCRVHRATVLRRHGAWSDAEHEARQACAEMEAMHVLDVAAWAYAELGEIRRRLGDLAAAEEAFRKSEEIMGQTPAGLALVRLAQGRIDAASAVITRVLAEIPGETRQRAALLPAEVQIAIAAGDLERARAAADELDRIATTFAGPALVAAAATARGRVQLAEGDCAAACATLQSALRTWQELDVPHEAATVRVLLGESCRNRGDEEGATAAFGVAAREFERLGAALDMRQLRDSLHRPTQPAGLTDREAEVLRLVATGLTNKEIATKLFLSDKTVARHLSNIFLKLGVSSRSAATAFAIESGIARHSG